MIEKIECEIMHCDGCDGIYENYWGERMFVDVEYKAIKCGGWVKNGDRHYCRACAVERGLIKEQD